MAKIEFFGVSRLKAGRSTLFVEAHTLREALTLVESIVPTLRGQLLVNRASSEIYRFFLNGLNCSENLDQSIDSATAIVIVSADCGG